MYTLGEYRHINATDALRLIETHRVVICICNDVSIKIIIIERGICADTYKIYSTSTELIDPL